MKWRAKVLVNMETLEIEEEKAVAWVGDSHRGVYSMNHLTQKVWDYSVDGNSPAGYPHLKWLKVEYED